ncbi:MAG: DUF5615 family PIN-like protein [Chloroflexota bacterium]
MSAICFLLDENVPLVIQAQLEQMEPTMTVHAIGDGTAPTKGTSDPDILAWVEARSCLLITNNRATMPVHLQTHLSQGRHVPGIVQLPRRMNIGAILDDLLLIWSASQPGEFQDQIVHLPLRR